ncbi:Oligo-1,6-glucosidase [compost metagenome]
MLLADDEQIYAFTRSMNGDQVLVICNFSEEQALFELPKEIRFKDKELLIANYEVDPGEEIKAFNLKPYEARAYQLK